MPQTMTDKPEKPADETTTEPDGEATPLGYQYTVCSPNHQSMAVVQGRPGSTSQQMTLL